MYGVHIHSKYLVVYKLTRKISSPTCLRDRDVAGFRQPGIIVLVPGTGKTPENTFFFLSFPVVLPSDLGMKLLVLDLSTHSVPDLKEAKLPN